MTDTHPKIMVVDDDPGMRLTLEGIIEDEGYDVVGAEDGYRAIELAKQSNFALILMDIKMPGINGLEAYREIKRVSPNSVVVMITGFSVEDLVKEALEEGAYAVIYKPFEMEQILDIVNHVLKTTLVLLVDDKAADRLFMRAILEETGYEVQEASNGAEAIAMAAEKHYAVILMDIKMPDMDGFTALDRIRQFDPQAKAIFISGYTLDDSVIASLRAALPKPVDPDQLLELMRSLTKTQMDRESR